MNTSQLSAYAPKARRDFIKAVTDRAAHYGLTADQIEPITEQGDVALIGANAFPREVAVTRRLLEKRIEEKGFAQVMEAVAYTWFNRFAAIRFMELHGYLEHGYRVLSHPEGQNRPEILDHAADVDLPGLDREKVIGLKLDGTRDEELYRLLILAQCNALHEAMPFLFEAIGGADELLLPANLLHTDSLIRRMVEDIDEDQWQEIEIIGWLYQFYISEKKDDVIGRVVKSEDIPAATQLFTPNWIVKYMVQNSLGAQWLATYPNSPLKGQMEYYIEPAEQTDEVKAQLAAITPITLNPEEMTLIDPASGSGHILVEAYELFKAIYLERGYRQRDVPQLILEKNLFGLDIDERAAQLTGFALMMKGRADDRRLFERGVKLNVMALQDSTSLNADVLAQALKPRSRIELVPTDDLLPETMPQPMLSVESKALGADIDISDIRALIALFEHATTFGSLIQVPEGLTKKLSALKQLSEATSQDLFVSEALKRMGPLVSQAELLAAQYDAVVANPPYMGGKGMNAGVKALARDHFPDTKSDLFACFMERGYTLAKAAGSLGMVTMQSWMFLSSFERMRLRLLRKMTIRTMAHLGSRAFGSITGEVVQTAMFVLQRATLGSFKPSFFNLQDGGENEKRRALVSGAVRTDTIAQLDFVRIPGAPIAYWLGSSSLSTFSVFGHLGARAKPRQGMSTNDNARFLRNWYEVAHSKIGFAKGNLSKMAASGQKWFPYNKGGGFRRWYGNAELVVNWADDGREIKHWLLNNPKDPNTKHWSRRIINTEFYGRSGLTWTFVGSSALSVRYTDRGFLFDVQGSSIFPDAGMLRYLGLLCSNVASHYLKAFNPTLSFQASNIASIPWRDDLPTTIVELLETLIGEIVRLARFDWDAYERSWEFQSQPLLSDREQGLGVREGEPSPPVPNPCSLSKSYTTWITRNRETIAEMKRLEEENNRLFIDAYGLADEVTPDVPIDQITLTVNPAYRYGGKLTEEEQWTRFRQDTMEELVSYAIGCMMGRYSLDAPGLIYAHSGNEGFDPGKYTTLPADSDGIIPITDTDWFSDDAANRFVEFMSVAWPKEHLEQNLTFLADNLGSKSNESPRDTIRRYLSQSFFKDHLQTYKKRPIYWLFSSGKQRAFQCLVYLHRYNEGTLARMRTEYVIPLQGQMASRIDHLGEDIAAATSTAHSRRLEKERERLQKQQAELVAFDEKLRHYADQRISLDLDDGVKVNYGKFGDLLAEVKAVTGK